MRVHLLATVRRAELLSAALLVFRTIRVGFPTADICVWGNGLLVNHAAALEKSAGDVGGTFTNLPRTVHDRWLEHIVLHEDEPLWICDTDVVFWDKVEDWFATTVADPLKYCSLSGRLEPSYFEQWTFSMSVERLHTCLMYVNPRNLRLEIGRVVDSVPKPFGATAHHALIRQHFIPRRGAMPMFYDTTAGLWQAGIGMPFNDRMNEAFDHLHGGTFVDLIAPHLTGGAGLAHCHVAVYENLEAARGMYARQKQWYAARSPERIPINGKPDQIRQQLRGNQCPDADIRQQGAGSAGHVAAATEH